MDDKQKRLVLFGGIGCALLMLLGCCATGIIVYLVSQKGDAPVAYSQAFLEDVRDGSYGDALARMSGPYQEAHREAMFRRRVESLDPLTEHVSAELEAEEVEEGRAEVGGVLIGVNGDRTPISITLSELGDYWYIDGIVVDGEPLR